MPKKKTNYFSTNGTYLQGMKLGPGRVVPLNDRDEIRIDIRLNESKTEATDAIRKNKRYFFSYLK